MTLERVMVDTWAWLALNDEDDADHELAELTHQELLDRSYVLVTTNFILDETYTLLRRRVSARQAIQFGQDIQRAAESGALELITIGPEIEAEARHIFETLDVFQGGQANCQRIGNE